MTESELKNRLFEIHTPSDYNALAIDIFHYQKENNRVYQKFLQLLNYTATPKSFEEIPCVPVSFFKSQALYCGDQLPDTYFTSSGTTGSIQSRHYYSDLNHYLKNARNIFEQEYGALENYYLYALLPGYQEREGSSLIAMVKHFLNYTKPGSGFFLHRNQDLANALLHHPGEKKIVIGVTYALLDFAEEFPNELNDVIIMETGGMKGTRKEMIKTEVHDMLKKAFHLNEIHSEYGMTEMFSQAYSKGNGIFKSPSTLRIRCRAVNDPFELLPPDKTGLINVYDLACIDSIAFIAIDDLGKYYRNETFEILGRLDHSDIRGCNLLVQ